MSVSGVALLAHVLLLFYATRAVCARVQDRRQVNPCHVKLVRGSWIAAVATMVVAAGFDVMDHGRRLAAVGELWDLGFALCCLTYALAIRILIGERRRGYRPAEGLGRDGAGGGHIGGVGACRPHG